MTAPTQTSECATQTSPVKYKVLDDSDTEILTDEETGSGISVKQTKSEARGKKGTKGNKKQLEAGGLESSDDERVKVKKKRKKNILPLEDTEIEESQSPGKSNLKDDTQDVIVKVKGKRKAKAKKKKEKKAAKKKPKKEAKFVKGKINPKIQLLNFDNGRESTKDNPFVDCCTDCSNRNTIRAVLTNNMSLMNNCINSVKHLSTLFDSWSPEINNNAFYYAIITNNLRMIQALIQANKFPKYYCRRPVHLIHYLDTGLVSEKAFGVKVRKVQMARGNRQGNNAFLEKTYKCEMYYSTDINWALANPKLECDTLDKLMILKPEFKDILNSSIISAIASGNRKIAAYLIKRIKALPNYGFNDLHYEVLALDTEDLTAFHRQSIHKKATGNDCVTPTHCACINPNKKYIEALFAIDPNVNLTDLFNRKPIHYAAACESSEPLEVLFKHGATTADLDNFKRSPLHYAAICNRGANVRLLIDKDPRMLKARDKDNMMPFHCACLRGNLDAVKAFIEKGANPNLGSGSARLTPLGYAAAFNHYEVCEFLLGNKARVLGKDKFKRTPLMMAARNGNVKLVNLLLRKGTVWDEPDSSGNTALHYAAAYGWRECAEELLNAGANVNANSSWKITPLNIAMLKNHFGLVKYLLNQPNVDVNCKDEQGRTLISLAVELTNDEALNYVTYLLRDKNADPNIADINNRTPLYYLITKKIVGSVSSYEDGRTLTQDEIQERTQNLLQLRRNMIVLLLKYKANINVLDKEGHTLFDNCLESGNYELMELFTGIASFSNQPALLFSFAKLIYNPKLKQTFDHLLKNSAMNKELINIKDNEGFTPFLRYLKTFIDMAPEVYDKIYRYIQYTLKKLKYEGSRTFTKEALKISYDNYMSDSYINYNNQPYDLNNYLMYSLHNDYRPVSDIEYIKNYTLAEFNNTFVDVIVKVLNDFVSYGADPCVKVDKLKVIQEVADPQVIDNPIPRGRKYREFVPTKVSKPISITEVSIEPKYSIYGLKNAWHFVVQRPLKQLMDLLLTIKVPIDEGDLKGNTPFMELMNTDNGIPFMDYNKTFYFLKDHGASIDKADLEGETPLLRMASEMRFNRVVQLLREGAYVDANDKRGNFALKYAVEANDINNVKILLEEFKADPNKQDKKLRCCLHIAVNNSSSAIDATSIMENLLLDYGAKINAIDKRGRSPLHYAFVKIGDWMNSSVIDSIETVTTLCSKLDINLNIQDKWGKTPLHYAAQRNSTISSIFLLNRGASLETKDIYGNTPLAIAFLYNHPDYSITLIERNANVLTLVNPENPKLLKDEDSDEMQQDKIIKKKRKWGPENVMYDQGANYAGGIPYKGKNKYATNMNYSTGITSFVSYPYNTQKVPTVGERTVTFTPKSMFRIAIQRGWQGLLYLLLDKNYDYMLGMEDALSESKYQLLLNLLKKTTQDSTVQKFNDKQQNLMHILASHGGNANYDTLKEIYTQFVKRGVKHMAIDNYGRSALHYAVQARNERMVNILLNENYDPNLIDVDGYNPLSLLVKGSGIGSSERLINELILAGSDLNVLYLEDYYKKRIEDNTKYFTTPLIHLVRYSLAHPKCEVTKRLIVSFLNNGADSGKADSDDRDVFIYCALENSQDMTQYLLHRTNKYNPKIVDKYGRTAAHYAVRQYNLGSYQNEALLDILLKHNFDYLIPDNDGLTAVDYAARQSNGRMATIFKARGIPVNVNVDIPKTIEKIIPEEEWPLQVDFSTDAERYMQSIEQLFEKQLSETKAKVDPIGNTNEPLEVIYDSEKKPYDCYLNKVNIRNGTYGEYVFYRMQLIRNTNRDVYIVYTRWGRIGDTGMFQKTPFGTKEEAESEFCKIFKSKSGNEWRERDNFTKVKKKFVMMAMKSNKLHYKQLIKPFDYKHIPHKTNLSKPIKKLLKMIVNVASYEKAMKNYGIDNEELPITQLKKETLSECKKLLDKLAEDIEKLKKEQEKGLLARMDDLEIIYEKINDISSQYYELLPQAAYNEFKPPPLTTQDQLNRQYTIIEDLLNIESASKILLGAQSRLLEMNPLDYCYKAMAISLEIVKDDSEEYELINGYISRSIGEDRQAYGMTRSVKIEHIFRLQRRGEYEQFKPSLGMMNRMLLYHGSSISNFLGILSQGLRVAPPNVNTNGWAFGKGIYFADMFTKSSNYCYNFNDNTESKLMLICEVALGKMATALQTSFKEDKPPSGFDSVKAKGSRGPNMDKHLHLEDGSLLPIGEIVDYKTRQGLYTISANEYIVFRPNQVRMRYLIQWKN